ncbi:hypothetical protein [Fictibacillus arsenicus]|uniref:Uncharacterized protein n=1 Tax=Fictibacillus arsenicus TaxID=255247 RepID=A0A1V3GB06_9BACL|nr:hypothetical protein [Fictibacillus arsenicus]OOE14046.1 hypothetical protein UN64_02195 [Fictibacillus arsenicus]
MIGSKTKSGVFVFNDFRDNLIIDRYDPVFQGMRKSKLSALCSENSEDAITWNVFKTLEKINPRDWLPYLIKRAFNDEFENLDEDNIRIHLWKQLTPPDALSFKEGKTEVDVIIESENFVWFIEAKYKSDISIRTKNNSMRNQIIRNIDIGLDYANDRPLLFSLLVLDEKHSPKGVSFIKELNHDWSKLSRFYPKRENNRIENILGVSVITWSEIEDVFSYISEGKRCVYHSDSDTFFANQIIYWLRKKGIQSKTKWFEQELFGSYYKNLSEILRLPYQAYEFALDNIVDPCLKYRLPSGIVDIDGLPIRENIITIEDTDEISEYDFEYWFGQLNNGLPIWWKKEKKDFEEKFFTLLKAHTEYDEEYYWNMVKSDPNDALELTFRILACLFLNND